MVRKRHRVPVGEKDYDAYYKADEAGLAQVDPVNRLRLVLVKHSHTRPNARFAITKISAT